MKKILCLLMLTTLIVGCGSSKKDLSKMKNEDLLKYVEENGSIKRKDDVITLKIENGDAKLDVEYTMNINEEYSEDILKTTYDDKVVYLSDDNDLLKMIM